LGVGYGADVFAPGLATMPLWTEKMEY
jgi:hypothetical protein